MSDLSALAGDVMCIGFSGAALDEETRRHLAALRPGGLVLFGGNVGSLAATRQLVADARAAVGGDVPPFTALDQEGGRVARLRAGAHELPAPMALGACDDPALAERYGAALGEDCARAGVGVNFAPCLDLATDPGSRVIATRAFGDDPQRVAALGAAVMRGMARFGVAATPKHFPGHGATAADSHRELPEAHVDVATLRARELVPYRAAFAAGARAVMTAHVRYPPLDPERPATISPRILGALLRDELGFTGVCVTDSLEMGALGGAGGAAAAAVRALVAGADVVLVSHDSDAAVATRDAIIRAVGDGTLPRARLEEAARRTLGLRRAVSPVIDPAPDPSLAEVGAAVARGAILRLRGGRALDGTRPVNVVSFAGETASLLGARDDEASLHTALRRRRLRAELMRVPLAPSEAMRAHLAALVRMQPAHELVLLIRHARTEPAQREAIAALLALVPDGIVVCARTPFDAVAAPRAREVLCSFGDDVPTQEALADVLLGRAPARGISPVAEAIPR